MESGRTLERHCFDGVCHCDWRLTLTDCSEAQQLWYIHLSHVICASLVATLGIGLLIHRLASRNFKFWYFSATLSGGYYRPRPVEAVVVFCTLMNILRIVNAVYLMYDVAPDSMIPRTFMFDIPWQFGYGGLLIYVVNIAESIAHSRNSGKGLPFSPFTVDTLGLFLFIVPFVVNNALNIASGAIHRTHLYAAETLQRLLYLSWTLCTGALAAAAVYFGIWVIRFLNARAHMSQTSGMILKLQVAVISFAICLAGFAIFLGIYGASRDRIMANPIGNMILAIVWNYWGTFGSLFAMLAVTLSPRTIPGLVNSKLRDPAYPDPREEGTTTVEDTCFGGQTTLGAVTTRFQNDYDAIFHAIKKGRGLDVGKHSWKRLHVDHDSDILELEIAYHPNK